MKEFDKLFLVCKVFSILLMPFCLFLFFATGYNSYQGKYATSIEKFEREFIIDSVELSGGKYSDIRLTGSSNNGKIKLSVKEIPINKTKFIVVFETFKQPNGKEFTTQTFGGYR